MRVVRQYRVFIAFRLSVLFGPTDGCRSHRPRRHVFIAFRLSVLFGRDFALVATIHPQVASSLPFGSQSSSDVLTGILYAAGQSAVFIAFRLSVLFGLWLALASH